MEAASKKRGRPRKHSEKLVKSLATAWGSLAKTPRQQQAIWFAQQAAKVLAKRGKFIKGVEQLIEDRHVRFGVLEQLGRLLVETGCSDKAIIAHAREVNKLFADDPKMTTRQAEKIIRIVRREFAEQGN